MSRRFIHLKQNEEKTNQSPKHTRKSPPIIRKSLTTCGNHISNAQRRVSFDLDTPIATSRNRFHINDQIVIKSSLRQSAATPNNKMASNKSLLAHNHSEPSSSLSSSTHHPHPRTNLPNTHNRDFTTSTSSIFSDISLFSPQTHRRSHQPSSNKSVMTNSQTRFGSNRRRSRHRQRFLRAQSSTSQQGPQNIRYRGQPQKTRGDEDGYSQEEDSDTCSMSRADTSNCSDPPNCVHCAVQPCTSASINNEKSIYNQPTNISNLMKQNRQSELVLVGNRVIIATQADNQSTTQMLSQFLRAKQPQQSSEAKQVESSKHLRTEEEDPHIVTSTSGEALKLANGHALQHENFSPIVEDSAAESWYKKFADVSKRQLIKFSKSIYGDPINNDTEITKSFTNLVLNTNGPTCSNTQVANEASRQISEQSKSEEMLDKSKAPLAQSEIDEIQHHRFQSKSSHQIYRHRTGHEQSRMQMAQVGLRTTEPGTFASPVQKQKSKSTTHLSNSAINNPSGIDPQINRTTRINSRMAIVGNRVLQPSNVSLRVTDSLQMNQVQMVNNICNVVTMPITANGSAVKSKSTSKLYSPNRNAQNRTGKGLLKSQTVQNPNEISIKSKMTLSKTEPNCQSLKNNTQDQSGSSTSVSGSTTARPILWRTLSTDAKIDPRKIVLTPSDMVERNRRYSTISGILSPKSVRRFADLDKPALSALANGWKAYQNAGHEWVNKKVYHRLETSSPTVKEIFFKAAFLNCFGGTTAINTVQPAISKFAAPTEICTQDTMSKSDGNTLIASNRKNVLVRPQTQNKVCTMNDHQLMLKQFWEDILMHLSDNKACISNLQEIGRRHSKLRDCGFTPDIWEKFGECSVEVITALDGMGTNKDACKAWRKVIACVTHHLRIGFESGCREIKSLHHQKINKEYKDRERRHRRMASSQK